MFGIKLTADRKRRIWRTVKQVAIPALILFLNDMSDTLNQMQGKYGFIAVIAGAAFVSFAQNLKDQAKENKMENQG